MKPSFDMVTARVNLDRATAARRAFLRERFQKATANFQAILRMIIEKYHPARVWQWGSLLDETSFTDCSDIDIGLEGIADAPSFFSLYGDAMALTDFPLDIVQLEKIEPEFSSIIRGKGKIVYERT